MRTNLMRGLLVALLVTGVVHVSGEWPGVASAEAAPYPTAQGQELPEGVTPEMIEAGAAVYADAGLCMTCHGAEGAGTPIGPPLNDTDWVHIDGSFESLVQVIDEGVMEPVDAPTPMLPRGGSGISDEDVEAVAAYVWSLSRGE